MRQGTSEWKWSGFPALLFAAYLMEVATVVRESVVVETSRGRTPQEWKEKCEMKEVVEEKKIVGEDGKEQAVKVTIEEKVYAVAWSLSHTTGA